MNFREIVKRDGVPKNNRLTGTPTRVRVSI